MRIEDVLGRGERGLRAGIGLGVFQYQYLLIACEEARVGPIVETVGPYLRRFGGPCLISDAQRITGWRGLSACGHAQAGKHAVAPPGVERGSNFPEI